MESHALKEWAVTVEALARGDQVLVVRKGGIGEKTFDVPHRRFVFFPTFAHQRPELVKAEHRDRLSEWLDRRDEPELLPLPAWAEVDAAYPVTEQSDLDAIDHLHILSADYAAERLRWRPKHPLWAMVLRVHRYADAPVLRVGAEHGGCTSWVPLPAGLTERPSTPALDDDRFARAAAAVRDALARAAA